MKTFAAFAVAATVAAFATSSFAAEAPSSVNVDSVRISLVGKTGDQVRGEIRLAAETVCGAPSGDCWTTSVRKANADFNAITRAGKVASAAPVKAAKLEASASVRVALVGRSAEQIKADIAAAADTVCKATNGDGSDFRACVAVAVRSANNQLRQFAQADRSTQVASL